MKLIRNLAAVSVGMLALSSCSMFNDGIQECPPEPKPEPPVEEPQPIDAELSFVYDYNMEYKDYFDAQVHCLDLYIFDENGKKVTSYSDDSKSTDGNYKVPVQLFAGKYTAIVYGGTACKDASFQKLFTDNDNLTIRDLGVTMYDRYFYRENESTQAPGDLYEILTDEEHESLRLHRFFYGKTDFEISDTKTKATLALDPVQVQRNTNIIKVDLKDKNGKTITINDYHLLIEDDNNSYNWDNSLKKDGKILYRPYIKDDAIDNELSVEFTISRLTVGNEPKLKLTKTENNVAYPDIDLITEILKSNSTNLPPQEYLDRENTWKVTIEVGDDPQGLDMNVKVEAWDYNQSEMDI